MGELELVFELSKPWHATLASRVVALVQDFVAVGDRGGYRRSGLQVRASTMADLGVPVLLGSRLSLSVVAHGVDGRAFQLLRHMASRIDYGDAKLKRIGVHQKNVPGPKIALGVVTEEDEDEMYLSVEEYAFSVDWSDDADKQRLVVVEFGVEVGATEVHQLEALANSWGRLLEQGAFAMPVNRPDEVDNVMGQVTLLDAYAVQIEVPVYRSSECGWTILLNLLEGFHESVLGIVNVEMS